MIYQDNITQEEQTAALKSKKYEYQKQWYAKNEDRCKEKRNIYRELNKERLAIKQKEHDLKHKEARKIQARELYLKNKESGLKKEYWVKMNREYYQRNREKKIAAVSAWRKNNPGKRKNGSPENIKKRHKEWYDNNTGKARLSTRIWQKANPDRCRSHGHERRSKERGVKVEKFDVSVIYTRDAWVCQLCGKKVDRKLRWPNPMSKSLDHIVPISLGGEHSRANIQLAHLKCNLSLGNRGIKQTRLF
jgi:5-methylcytosine-specific restriction endonuclease McrA